MKPIFTAVLASALLVATPRPARADLAQARKHLEQGEYGEALTAFKKLARGRTRGEALLGQAEVYRQTGRYAAEARVAHRALRIRAVAGPAAVAYARSLMRVGKYPAAIRVLEKAVGRDSKNFAARALLGRAYVTTGHTLKAGVIAKDLFRDWDNGLLDKKKAEDTFYVGLAGLYDKNWQFASDAFEQALKIDPKLFAANLVWGNLFMSKYNVPDAERCFKDVLKVNPMNADAWAGWAWVEWYAARPKRAKGRERALKALKINPNHIEAMLYLASQHLYDAEYGKALILAERALKVNPHHLRALAHLAAVYFLRGKTAKYKAVEARMKKVNPRDSDFYFLISRFATRHHLYPEAVALNQTAKAMDPKNANALAALGIALLRTGKEGEGLFWLKEAWKVDKFNHQTLNLLNLYDELAKKYTTVKAGRFEFKVPKDEARIIKRYLPGYLNKVLAGYMKKYHWRPKGPIKIELYESLPQFTVRTFGEPHGGGILGVCFGHVITALSPSVGAANWAMVLHHELAHTVHIDISRSRVPRWFTEGLAEYETIISRPEWRREHRLDVWRAIHQKTLAGIEDLNRAFTHSKSPKGVVIAYFQSSMAVSFIAKRWGYRAINRALRLFATHQTTAQVIPAITGLSTAAFDQQFTAWLKHKWSYYKKSFDPFSAVVVPLEELQKRAQAAPKSASAQANLAVGLFVRRKLAPAQAALTQALKLDPRSPVARFLKAELARMTGKKKEALAIYRALKKDGHDGYAVQMRLGAAAAEQKQWTQALSHYKRAQGFDPERAKPYDARIQIFNKLKKNLDLVKELAGLSRLKEGSGSLLYSIVMRADKLHRWDIVRRYGRQAVEIQPMNVLVHEKYGWALKAGRRYKQAIFEFGSALAAIPEVMPPAQRDKMKYKQAWLYLGIAECWAALRDPERAREAVRKALDRNANLPRALQLRKRLNPNAGADDNG